ncbi:MAG: 4-hydroxy-tetrahydrodipicolinate synthase [Alphaproteobacteria bacterium]|nr:4-hydroxy-tetrahydrodipicolinate synthase [Alphaproteobacteria bacterium]
MRAQETWLWTALVTPFTPDAGKVDYAALGSLLKRQNAAGNGILILGSTGESLSLNEDEKKEIVRFTMAQKLSVPVMIGLPNINAAQTMGWIDFCRGQGADAYLAATPAYTKPGAEGQVGWFTHIFDAVDAPVMLYNVPSRTGASLSPAVLRALQSHRNFWAVKESSGGLEAYVDYAAAAPNVALYCGDDNLLAPAASLGACGLVSVASNMWPEACAAYVAGCRDATYRGQDWWIASKALFTTASPVPLKALMHRRGLLPSSAVRSPLSVSDLASFDLLDAADKRITEWHASFTRAERAA